MIDAMIYALLTVFDVIITVTVRCLIKVLTFGRWRVAEANESRVLSAAGSLSFHREGRRVITETGQNFLGALVYGLLCTAVAAWAYWG